MRRSLSFAVSVAAAAAAVLAAQDRNLRTAEARHYIGSTATVCGSVMAVHYLSASRGQPTLLDIDKTPKPEFSVMIAGADRAKFGGSPEVAYRDKVICITGRIRTYEEGVQIIATDPKQIDIQGER
jgi:hypothetical protein